MIHAKPRSCELERGARVDLGRLVRAEDGGPTRWATTIELGWDEERLRVRFQCEDDDAWGTLETHDSALWTEEVVEVFLAPGAASPSRYFELEVSPRGVVFDAEVLSPHGDRCDLDVRPEWTCAGLEVAITPRVPRRDWSAEISIPWRALVAGRPPEHWRLNLFRIERPRDGAAPELSAWSPTLVTPADFHRPARFGHLRLLR